MIFRLKFLLIITLSLGLIIYFNYKTHIHNNIFSTFTIKRDISLFNMYAVENDNNYNVWITLTKVKVVSPLKYKFQNLIFNLLNVTTVPLHFHIIVDDSSKDIAIAEFSKYTNIMDASMNYTFYYIDQVASLIKDIVSVLTPHFSSRAGTYYSDALFYISLGLYKIAPENQNTAIMLDCDLYFKHDIKILFDEFHKFKETALYGLAPELTPVYKHVLHSYRVEHKNSTFGNFYNKSNSLNAVHPSGFQGYNSGVILLNLKKIRNSKTYQQLLTNKSVNALTSKYKFRGHLGDQDFYTLLGYEHPNLIQTLNCGFNRQLCLWWRDHGYSDIFYNYFKCDHKIIVLHGNCNTKIPK